MGAELKSQVAVIGGGCAGLAAASRLAEMGIVVTLYESSPHLGGRARGVQYKGLALDNGPHILLGAYSETLRLLKLAGVTEEKALLRMPLQLTIQNEFSLRAMPCLPAPLHILAGLLTAKGLSIGERLAAIRFMVWMSLAKFKLTQDETLQNLLRQKAQPKRVIKLLWEPLCVAALNTPIQIASAQVYLNVLRDSFSKAKLDSDMLLPRCDLSTLIADPVAAYIQRAGGSVLINTTVSGLRQDGDGFLLACDKAQSKRFSHVIIAVSPFRLDKLTEQLPKLTGATYSYQPIYTVYLQYPESVKLAHPMIGLTKSYSQWVFDRGLLCGQHGMLGVVISAEGPHQKLTQEDLALAVIKELSGAFPNLPAPLWHKVIAEKRATFSCTPDLQRPPQLTAITGLYLVGDYVAGDYPATIEGAVRSGVSAANHIIASLNPH